MRCPDLGGLVGNKVFEESAQWLMVVVSRSQSLSEGSFPVVRLRRAIWSRRSRVPGSWIGSSERLSQPVRRRCRTISSRSLVSSASPSWRSSTASRITGTPQRCHCRSRLRSST